MKYQIAKKSDGLEIKVAEVEGKELQLIEAFQACQEGCCSCPSQEYQKLDSLQIEQKNGEICLRLKHKNGAQFDQVEIERCLEQTNARIKSQK